MNTWIENILNCYAAFERETVTFNAAADDGKTSEIESFGSEKNLIIVKVNHVVDWYFGDITFKNSIRTSNIGRPGTDLKSIGQTSIIKNDQNEFFYGYAAFTVPEGSAENDDYALTIRVINSDATVPDSDYLEVSVMTTVILALNDGNGPENQEGDDPNGGTVTSNEVDDDERTSTYMMWLFPVLITILLCLVSYFIFMPNDPNSGYVVYD